MKNTVANFSSRIVLATLLFLALLTSGASLAIAIARDVEPTPDWWVGWLQNFSTEMFGAVVTFILLEVFVSRRRDTQRLIIQLRSPDNATALGALEQLRVRGCLIDGTLAGIDLSGANLQNADLSGANLKGTKLVHAILNRAKLESAVLVGADLRQAQLNHAELSLADLSRADLRKTSLMSANLTDANLRGADMRNANIERAIIWHTNFDDRTVLPNRRRWTEDTRLTRYGALEKPKTW